MTNFNLYLLCSDGIVGTTYKTNQLYDRGGSWYSTTDNNSSEVCQVDVNWVMKNISAFLTVSTFVSETKLITGEAGSDILYYGISVYTLYTHAVNE